MFVLLEEELGGVFDASSFALLLVEVLLVGWLAVLFGDEDWFAQDLGLNLFVGLV